jgi:hypothetical protein
MVWGVIYTKIDTNVPDTSPIIALQRDTLFTTIFMEGQTREPRARTTRANSTEAVEQSPWRHQESARFSLPKSTRSFPPSHFPFASTRTSPNLAISLANSSPPVMRCSADRSSARALE